MRVIKITHDSEPLHIESATQKVVVDIKDDQPHVELELEDRSILICDTDMAYYNLIANAEVYDGVYQEVYLDRLLKDAVCEVVTDGPGSRILAKSLFEIDLLEYKLHYVMGEYIYNNSKE